jgi:HEAT repeat protein
MLLSHEDASVRKNVAEAMAKLGATSLMALAKAYENAKSHKTDRNAAHVRLTVQQSYLEMMKLKQYALLPDIIPYVLDALQDDTWLVRSQAALVLAQAAQYLHETPPSRETVAPLSLPR